jgi:hypothetical protein
MAIQLIKQLSVVCILLVSVGASPFLPDFVSDPLHNTHLSVDRRGLISATCVIAIPTYLWTTCSSILDIHNITVAEFSTLNPSVSADCSDFVPGEHYCLKERE